MICELGCCEERIYMVERGICVIEVLIVLYLVYGKGDTEGALVLYGIGVEYLGINEILNDLSISHAL